MTDGSGTSSDPLVNARPGSLAEQLLLSRMDTWPEPSQMPLILDSDIGSEPDDALALAVAAGLPSLELVLTSDERDGDRARLARYLLDLLGRTDVPVVAGRDLGNRFNWAAETLIPGYVPAQPTDIAAAVSKVLDRHDGQVGWIGLGPMSNLAELLTVSPALSAKLVVTQQEAAFRVFPDSGGQNVIMDPSAARTILDADLRPWIVPGDITFHVTTVITEETTEYKVIAHSDDPARVLLRRHMDEWFDDVVPGFGLHGLLTLSLGIGMPFLTATPANISLDEADRIQSGSSAAFMVTSADYSSFRKWLVSRLDQIASISSHHPAAEYNPRTPRGE
ncbi:nucleoside hydrolase [Nocardia sp. CA-128927]|uniref:nucleoside hydrolase n=1 Tax=Nocardia sp. CA-128927 TaxID=3239975 RepID=UPI003D968F58